MFDTIALRLYTDDLAVRPLEVLPPMLSNVSEHIFNGGDVWVSGNLGGLTITANQYQVKLKEGSLCKWWLGDNFQALGKRDTKDAIEALSDALSLPMDRADVLRLDVANNFVMQYPIEVYLEHLGEMRYYKRLAEPSGLYYSQSTERLAFYDKIKEQKRDAEKIPELYQDRQVLRYEQRFIKRVAKRLKTASVRASDLYDDAFYKSTIQRWCDTYKSIEKQSEIKFNWQMVSTKKDFYRLGTLALVEMAGGKKELLQQIREAQKQGLSPKQAFDLRRAVRDACKADGALTIQHDCIKELNEKVDEAAKIYG